MAKLLILSACLIALGAACGSDDEGGSNAGTGAGATGGTAGSSGTSGGTSGTGGTGGAGSGGTGGAGSGGTGGTGGTVAEPVVCGGVTCAAPTNTRLRACCIEADNTCGEKIPGGFVMSECAAPVVPDDECESVSAMGFTVPSCCTPEGRCGITAPLIGLECTANEDLADLAADAGLNDGGTSDGGMEDGGRGFTNPFAGMAPDPGPCTPD